MDEKFLRQIDEMMARRIGTLENSFGDKLDLLVDGQQMLSERMDRLEVRLDERIDGVEQRIDGIAADVSAHRRDTEAHRKGWRVREGWKRGSVYCPWNSTEFAPAGGGVKR